MKENKVKGIMKTRFNNTIAKKIAQKNFDLVIDCLCGYSDTGYNLYTEAEEFEQNFEESLEEMNITVTDKRIEIISNHYNKFINKLRRYIEKTFYNGEKL